MTPLPSYLTTTTARKTMALIYGPPITGKTTGARTFPNPHIIDFDNNLPPGTPNVVEMWNDEVVDKIKSRKVKDVANRMDALLVVASDLGHALPENSTIIIDSLTRVESWVNIQEKYEPQPRSNKTGEIDGHAVWRARLNYFDTLFTTLVGCAANVIFISHQQQDRNEKGEIVGQIRPALMGQIGEKLPGYFQTVMQACRQKNPDTKILEPIYTWRLRPSVFETARVPKAPCPEFILQQYSELVKYL